MKEIKTCCVTGHRDIPAEQMDRIQKLLRQEILAAIEDGYTHFISGFAAGADLLFANIVAELKEIYPITLEAAIPYPGRMKTPDETFQRLIRCCDTVKIHSDIFQRLLYAPQPLSGRPVPARDCRLRRPPHRRHRRHGAVCEGERCTGCVEINEVSQI